MNLKYNKEIPITCTIKPKKTAILSILKVGIPTAFMQGINSVAAVFVNMILIGFSPTAVAIYGVMLRVQNMFLVVPHGINLAVIPLVAYNYGAGNVKRQKETMKWALIYSYGFITIATVILLLFPREILGLFHASQAMMEQGVVAIRIMSVALFVSTYSYILGTVMQALGKGYVSMSITVARQALFLIPLLLVMCQFNDIGIVWVAFPFAELLGVMYGGYIKKSKRMMS